MWVMEHISLDIPFSLYTPPSPLISSTSLPLSSSALFICTITVLSTTLTETEETELLRSVEINGGGGVLTCDFTVIHESALHSVESLEGRQREEEKKDRRTHIPYPPLLHLNRTHPPKLCKQTPIPRQSLSSTPYRLIKLYLSDPRRRREERWRHMV